MKASARHEVETMRVTVRFFAALHEAVGSRTMEYHLDAGSTVESLLRKLTRDYPRLEPFCQAVVPSVNQEYTSPQTELREGDEVAFIPPVSGGCDDV